MLFTLRSTKPPVNKTDTLAGKKGEGMGFITQDNGSYVFHFNESVSPTLKPTELERFLAEFIAKLNVPFAPVHAMERDKEKKYLETLNIAYDYPKTRYREEGSDSPLHLIVDLGQQEANPGLGSALVKVWKMLEHRDGRLSVIANNDKQKDLFRKTGLDQCFAVTGTLKESLGEVKPSRGR